MERYYNSLFNYVEQLIVLPEKDKASIRESFKPLFVPKNTILEHAGQYYHFMHRSVSDKNLHCITDCELLDQSG